MGGMFYGCSKEMIIKIKTQYKNMKEEAFCSYFFFDDSEKPEELF